MKNKGNAVIVAFITLAGLGLRLYQIGTDSFWVDEVGVLKAAQSASLIELVSAIRNHILAMPLDYLITWGMLKLGQQEWFLRLPEAIWGTLSLPIAYLLFRKLQNERVGLISAGLLAISPFHIQYSQELRFYAPLVFFSLLSVWLLLRAFEKPNPANWVKFTLATLLGIFFHIYVIFSLVPGLFLMLEKERRRNIRLRLYFMRSIIALLLGLVIGLLVFGATNPYRVPIDLLEPSFLSTLAVGLGWLPFYSPVTPDITWLWGGLCLTFEIAGGFVLVKQRQGGLILAAMVSQFAMIILASFAKGYFLSPRHFIHLLPWMLFLAAIGIDWIIRVSAAHWQSDQSAAGIGQAGLVNLTLVILLVGSLLPALSGYYAGDKGRAKEISQSVMTLWQPQATIYIVPGNETDLFSYYLSSQPRGNQAARAVTAEDWSKILSETSEKTNNIIVITGEMAPPGYQQGLIQAGFKPVYKTDQPYRFPHELWVKGLSVP